MGNQRPNDTTGEPPNVLEATDPAVLADPLDALDASQDTRDLAHTLARTVEDTMWVVGHSRRTIAATAIYIASQATGENFTQTEIAEHADSSAAAISKRKHDLLDAYYRHTEPSDAEQIPSDCLPDS